MQRRPPPWFNAYRPGRIRFKVAAAWTGIALATGALCAPAVLPITSANSLLTARVRRGAFNALVVASGRVESTQNTEIRCNLERLSGGITPTILSMVADGSNVQAGDTLCEIDSADYVEMVRTQTINLDQVRASHLQAELDLDVARITFEAFKNGEMIEADRSYRGQIALAKADIKTRTDRLVWTRGMVKKGYMSTLQIATDRQSLMSASYSLKSTERAFDNYLKWSARKSLISLQSRIIMAQAQLNFQGIRLKRETERLALYKKQVDACVVKAPHKGMVLYANEAGRAPTIYEGASVRQRMKLFTLPNLSKMEVQALLHETVVNRVRIGMPVTVRIEALPGLEMEGTVSAISPLPLTARRSEQQTEVTYFLGRIVLDKIPDKLLPGMSAELEINTARRDSVLVVPHTAIVNKGDYKVCTVVTHKDDKVAFERRSVTTGEASHSLVEVTDGLTDGEVVVLDTQTQTPAVP